MAETAEKDVSSSAPRRRFFARASILCRLRSALLGAAIGIFLAVLIAHWVPRKYAGQVIFEHGPSSVAKLTFPDQDRQFESYKAALVEEMTSSRAVTEVVDDLGLTKGGEFPRDDRGELTKEGAAARQQLVRDFQKALRVEWLVRRDRLDRISVRLEHEHARLAVRVPDELAKNYMEGLLERIMTDLEVSRHYLSAKLADAKSKHEDALRAKQKFVQQYPDCLPEGPQKIDERLRELTDDIATVRNELQERAQKLAILEAYAQPHPPTTAPASRPAVEDTRVPNPEIDVLQTIVDDRQEIVIAARKHLGATHEFTNMLRNSVESLRVQLAETPRFKVVRTSIPERVHIPTRRDFTLELAAARAQVQSKEEELRGKLRDREHWELLDAQSAGIWDEFQRLGRQVEVAEEEVNDRRKDLAEVEKRYGAEASRNARVLRTIWRDPVPLRASSPRFGRIQIIAAVAGLILALVLGIWPIGRGRWGRIVLPVLTVLLVAGIVVLDVGLYLSLTSPYQYMAFRASPLAYIWTSLAGGT